ncbi:MAG: DMT family transporter, partial [Chloroflexota bacterium]|nr:DMT family transporter [Chloroflexota bacterium]
GFAIMVLIALALRIGPPADRRRSTLALIVMVGLFDTVANVLFVAGLAAGEATIVATASGLYPVLPALLAIVFLGERLALSQYVGVAVLVTGLLALGVLR